MAEIRDIPGRGTGLLAIFCDLDAEDRLDFRPWLTEDMFPARMRIGFNACASYDRVAGEGQQFLTLYEMPSLGHLYGEAYQGLRRDRKPRDAAYHEKFRNPDRYTLAWAGPELAAPDLGDTAQGTLIRVDRFDLDASGAQDFNIRFITRYLPKLVRSADVVGLRRYLAMEGSPSHLVIRDCAAGGEDPGPLAWDFDAGMKDPRSGLYRRVIAL